MTGPEIAQIVGGAVGGAAGLGALAKVIFDHFTAHNNARIDLHRLTQEVAGELIEDLRAEVQRGNGSLDVLESRNNKLVVELATTHDQLRAAEREIVKRERALAVAEQDGSRKEREILKLKTRIRELEERIVELQARVERVTAALEDCGADCGLTPNRDPQ